MENIGLNPQLISVKLSQAFNQFGKWFKKTFFHPSELMKTFYALFVISILCFGYTWITHYFTVPLGGDYTLQEMTFLYNGYDDWHEFFKTGVFPTWDYSDFLGADNIGANSFYYLFDPFFLILLPFPRDWLLVLEGLEFVLKMTLAGMFFYWYLGSFKFSTKTRRIGAICFAFSGYSFSYLWFHFIDSVAFLPLILLGIENVIQKRDPRVLLVGFFLNGLTSYFFFVVFMIGGFFYAIFRFLQTMKQRSFNENWAVLGLGIFSFLLGIFLSAFTLIPGMVVALSMPRVSSTGSWFDTVKSSTSLSELLKNLFTYPSDHQHNQVTPLLNFLFMADDCYSSNLLNVYWYDNFAASLYATTPMLLLFCVSLIQSFREKKVGHIIGFCLVLFLIFSPIGFYLFSGFTVGYARYFILPIAWMIVFDCEALEKRRDIPRTYLDLAFVIVMILDIVSCYLMIYEVKLVPSYFSSSGWSTKMALIPGSMVWVVVCFALMRPFFHKNGFSKVIFSLCSIDIIVMANLTITFQGTTNIDSMAGGPTNIATETEIVSLLKECETDNNSYRIFNPTADRGDINISMREGYNGLGAFHSVYAYSCQDFLDKSRIPYSYHNWSMGIHNRRENLETFLGTKYYLVPKTTDDKGPYVYYGADYDIPYGYVNVLKLTDEQKEKLGVTYSDDLLSYLEQSNKDLYVNTNYIDTFFAYDTVINADWVDSSYEDFNEYSLLRAAMLDTDDYNTVASEKKYTTGSFTANGVTHTYSSDSNVYTNASLYESNLQTTNYVKGSSNPIEVYSGSKRLKATVYASQWPSTANNASGEYLSWTGDYAYPDNATEAQQTAINALRATWRSEHPFEVLNGITQADLAYNYDTHKGLDGNYSSDYTGDVLWNSKIVLTPLDSSGNETTLCSDADPSDPTTGSYISVKSTLNIQWRFIASDGSITSIDQPSYSDYKTAHGYYVDRPVSKIVGIIKAGSKESPVSLTSNTRPSLYIQRNSDYQEAIDSLKESAPTITKRTNSEIDFSTDYTANKFMVVNLPKQNGWKLYEKTLSSVSSTGYDLTEVTQYKAQGGFIGFEADKGQHTYVLEYESPYLKISGYASLFGFFIMLLCLAFFSSKHQKDEGYQYTQNLSYTLVKTKQELEYAYDNYEDKQ